MRSFDFSFVPRSSCHGDLTLENIIVTTNNELYLIDFLDSFYDSWMIDIAKLLQDLELKWSYRFSEDDSNREIRLLIAKEALLNRIRVMDNGQEIIRNVYSILLLNILRILPYSKDDITIIFIEESLNHTLDILNRTVL